LRINNNNYRVIQGKAERINMKISGILKDKGTIFFSIEPDQLLCDAVALMMQHKIGALIVLENGKLKSIVTERDVMGAVNNHKEKITSIKVIDVMAPKLVTCSSEDDIAQAMDMMTNNITKRRIRHLPVVDNGELAGVISIGDIVSALLTETKFENRLLKNYIQNWPDEVIEENG